MKRKCNEVDDYCLYWEGLDGKFYKQQYDASGNTKGSSVEVTYDEYSQSWQM